MKVEECEPCTYSPVSAVDYLPTGFSDTRQLSLLSGSHTPVKSLENEQQMDGFPTCECGKEMSDCSIHPNTPEKWIAYMRDSLAKTLALLESRQVYLREPDQVFTEKSCVLLTSLDRDTCSWRTLQQSFLTDSEPFSQTWPRWGMTQGGSAYAHPMSERNIQGIDGLRLLPTPRMSMYKNQKWWKRKNPMGNLEELPAMFQEYEHLNGQYINPRWLESHMMFPIGWALLKDWVMLKSRSKRRQHGDSLEVNK